MEELNPRQILFLTYYNDPESETFSNAYQSAVKAGFTEEYAKTITARESDWISENISRRKRILNKAEKRGELLIESEDEKVAADMVKHFTKTLGKEHYSERQEHTGKDGQPLTLEFHSTFNADTTSKAGEDNTVQGTV